MLIIPNRKKLCWEQLTTNIAEETLLFGNVREAVQRSGKLNQYEFCENIS